jgi:glyoxylase-like metal-dependent hydrolase (beta-lactamase superfamily II)
VGPTSFHSPQGSTDIRFSLHDSGDVRDAVSADRIQPAIVTIATRPLWGRIDSQITLGDTPTQAKYFDKRKGIRRPPAVAPYSGCDKKFCCLRRTARSPTLALRRLGRPHKKCRSNSMIATVKAAIATAALGTALSLALTGAASAQTPAAPATTTIKVDGTDNVYIFRYGGHQSMFVVTPAGVIATDPISYQRPAKPYIDAIKAVTDKPIKYVIYSHSHYDHAAGGKPFKDLGATFIGHRKLKERWDLLKKQNALLGDIVMPDQFVDDRKVITLGGTALELDYVGRNHSDNMLVMRLPKEKIIFVVDFAPLQSTQFRNIPDNVSPIEYTDSLKKLAALDWDRMILGHPQAGGRLGTKQDVQDDIGYMNDVSAEAKKLADAGKCLNDAAMKDVKLPKYEKWSGYETGLAPNVERWCYWWGRGY